MSALSGILRANPGLIVGAALCLAIPIVLALKAPLINAITRSGWTWRPVVWQGPVWLRWLTE